VPVADASVMSFLKYTGFTCLPQTILNPFSGVAFVIHCIVTCLLPVIDPDATIEVVSSMGVGVVCDVGSGIVGVRVGVLVGVAVLRTHRYSTHSGAIGGIIGTRIPSAHSGGVGIIQFVGVGVCEGEIVDGIVGGTVGVFVGVGVRVGVMVGVLVGVLVGVRVGVMVGVLVAVGVGVLVGVFIGILVGVLVGVRVGVMVGVLVGVLVGVRVGVMVGVLVAVGVGVLVGVFVGVGVRVGVDVGQADVTKVKSFVHDDGIELPVRPAFTCA
jgi:hypothetical protein